MNKNIIFMILLSFFVSTLSFALSPEEVIKLRDAGVSDSVIMEMIKNGNNNGSAQGDIKISFTNKSGKIFEEVTLAVFTLGISAIAAIAREPYSIYLNDLFIEKTRNWSSVKIENVAEGKHSLSIRNSKHTLFSDEIIVKKNSITNVVFDHDAGKNRYKYLKTIYEFKKN